MVSALFGKALRADQHPVHVRRPVVEVVITPRRIFGADRS